MTNVRRKLSLLLLSFFILAPVAHAQRSATELNDQIYRLKQTVRLQKLKEDSYRNEVIYPLQDIIGQIGQALDNVNKNDTRTVSELNANMASVKDRIDQCYNKLALMIKSREYNEKQLDELEAETAQ